MNKEIRVLFFIPSLSAYLDRIYAVSSVSPKIGKLVIMTVNRDTESEKLFQERGVTFVSVRNNLTKRKFSLYKAASEKAEEIINKYNINIVHDTFGVFWYLFAESQHNFKRITSIFNYAVWDFYEFHSKQYSLFKMFFNKDLRQCLRRIPVERKIVRNSDYVVVQSELLKEKLKKYHVINDDKILVIPNSVEPDLNNSKIQDFASKEKNRIPLLFSGGFSVAKGAVSLIELAAKAKKEDFPLLIYSVGGIASADKKLLLRRIKELDLKDYFNFVSRVSVNDMIEYYQEAYFLIHLSILEGSPRVVFEAMAKGLPIIATDIPGIRFLDEQADFIKYFSNSDDILNFLEKVTKDRDKWLQLSQGSKRIIEENYTSAFVGELYYQIYNKILR